MKDHGIRGGLEHILPRGLTVLNMYSEVYHDRFLSLLMADAGIVLDKVTISQCWPSAGVSLLRDVQWSGASLT